MKLTIVRQSPKIVVTAPANDEAPKVVVTHTTQRITVKRDGLTGPQGPAGPKGEDGQANIPTTIHGGFF